MARTAVLATHRECDNPVCRMVSFTYGSGRPALWSHDNLDEETHDWVRGEFGIESAVGRGTRVAAVVPLP